MKMKQSKYKQWQIESKKPTSMAKQTNNKIAELRLFDILCYFLMNLDKNIY